MHLRSKREAPDNGIQESKSHTPGERSRADLKILPAAYILGSITTSTEWSVAPDTNYSYSPKH